MTGTVTKISYKAKNVSEIFFGMKTKWFTFS